jgi:hypothetical protein
MLLNKVFVFFYFFEFSYQKSVIRDIKKLHIHEYTKYILLPMSNPSPFFISTWTSYSVLSDSIISLRLINLSVFFSFKYCRIGHMFKGSVFI